MVPLATRWHNRIRLIYSRMTRVWQYFVVLMTIASLLRSFRSIKNAPQRRTTIDMLTLSLHLYSFLHDVDSCAQSICTNERDTHETSKKEKKKKKSCMTIPRFLQLFRLRRKVKLHMSPHRRLSRRFITFPFLTFLSISTPYKFAHKSMLQSIGLSKEC